MPNILWQLLIFLQLFEKDADKTRNDRSKCEEQQKHETLLNEKWYSKMRNKTSNLYNYRGAAV